MSIALPPRIVLGCALLAVCLFSSCSVDVEVQRVTGPGGRLDAIVYYNDHGALDTSDVQIVEIVEAGGRIGSGERVATVDTTRSCPGAGPSVSVAWDSVVLELIITYPADSSISAKTQHGDVQMKLRHCDATYPDQADGAPSPAS